MNSDSNLLFYPIFWDKDKVLNFFLEYFELLNQGKWCSDVRNCINDLNNKKRSAIHHPCNDAEHKVRCGWLDKVWEKEENVKGNIERVSFIGAYLKYTEDSQNPDLLQFSYNGHLWFDLMRAIRNLYVHKYDTKIKGFKSLSDDAKTEVKQMQTRVRDLIAEGYLDYWLETFPDMLFVFYEHAIEKKERYIKLPTTDKDCNLRKNFIEKFYLEEVGKVSSTPSRLEDVIAIFDTFSANEAKNTSGLLLHSVKIVGGPQVHFMKYPESKFLGGIYTPNEIVVMTLSLEDIPDTGSLDLSCKIYRKLNTIGEKSMLADYFLKRLYHDSLKFKSTLTFRQTSVKNLSHDVINSLYIFTDDITSALLYQKMYFKHRKFKNVFVYTSRTFRDVEKISKNVFDQTDQNFVKNELSWKNLDVGYKKKLYDGGKNSFRLYARSKTSHDLKNIYSAIDDCKLNETQILQLMHEKEPALLTTGIPSDFNEKQFYNCSLESNDSVSNLKIIDDNTFKSSLLENCNAKIVTIIHGTACMGKSWLLMSTCCYLETQNQLVTFHQAYNLVDVLKNRDIANYDKITIIEILWESKLEQDIITKQSNKNKLIYLLIDDFSELVDETHKELLCNFIKHVRENLNVKLVVTYSKKEVEVNTFESYQLFSLQPVDINGFISHYFQDIFGTETDNSKRNSSNLETAYNDQCKNLGHLKETPFACRVWCYAYEKYIDLADPFKPNHQLNITEIHSYLVERQLKNRHPNYDYYVNTTVLMWPYLTKSFMERFSKFEPNLLKTGYITELFGDKISSSVLDRAEFLQGTINDYLIAYLVKKIVFLSNAGSLRANMCTKLWEILQVDSNEMKFKYEHIVEFLNSMCSAEMVRQVVNPAKNVNKVVHEILKLSLKFKYEQLFVSILSIMDPYDHEIEFLGPEIEDKVYPTEVFQNACQTQNYSVLFYLLKFNDVIWDVKDMDGSTCLTHVENQITNAKVKKKLTQKLKERINSAILHREIMSII